MAYARRTVHGACMGYVCLACAHLIRLGRSHDVFMHEVVYEEGRDDGERAVEDAHERHDAHRARQRAHQRDRHRLAHNRREREVEHGRRHHDVRRRRDVLAHEVLDELRGKRRARELCWCVHSPRLPRDRVCELGRQRLSVCDLAAHAHAAVPADQAVESNGALLIGRSLCPEHDAGEERGALEEAGVDLALGEQPLLLGRTLGCRAA